MSQAPHTQQAAMDDEMVGYGHMSSDDMGSTTVKMTKIVHVQVECAVAL